jgi:hypothetical protein
MVAFGKVLNGRNQLVCRPVAANSQVGRSMKLGLLRSLKLAGAVGLTCLVTLRMSQGGDDSHPGSDIARELIEIAKKNQGVVSLEFLGGKVCVAPPGGMAKPAAKRLFSGSEVVFLESDESEGIWFLMVESEPQKVKIYSIDQSLLHWKIDENNDIYRDLLKCPSEIFIESLGNRLTVNFR